MDLMYLECGGDIEAGRVGDFLSRLASAGQGRDGYGT